MGTAFLYYLSIDELNELTLENLFLTEVMEEYTLYKLTFSKTELIRGTKYG